MKDIEVGAEFGQPLWRRIVGFPLVAMIFALAVAAAGITAAVLINQ